MELTHIRLLVDNYKDCFHFYKDILGFEVTWGDENSNYADFKFQGFTLALFEWKQMIAAIGETYARDFEKVDRTALVFKVENVEKNLSGIKKEGRIHNRADRTAILGY